MDWIDYIRPQAEQWNRALVALLREHHPEHEVGIPVKPRRVPPVALTAIDVAGKRLAAINAAMSSADAMQPLRRLLLLCAVEFGICPNDLRGEQKLKKLLPPRFAMCWMARRAGYSLQQIGLVIQRDHTTVLHGMRRASDMMLRSQDYAARLAHIEERWQGQVQQIAKTARATMEMTNAKAGRGMGGRNVRSNLSELGAGRCRRGGAPAERDPSGRFVGRSSNRDGAVNGASSVCREAA